MHKDPAQQILDRTLPPPVAHFSDIEIQPEEVMALPNGTDLHVVRNDRMELARIDLLWDGGTLDFSNAPAVAATCATIQEATAHRRGSEVADIIDYTGARLGGGASTHHSSLALISASSRLDKLLPLLAELSVEASFPDNAVAAFVRRQVANIALQLERVSYRASKALGVLLKGKSHPDSHTVMPIEMEKVTRKDVLDIYDRLKQSPLHIFVGGKIDDKALKYLCDTFGSIPAPAVSPIKLMPFAPEPVQRLHIPMENVQQSAVAMGLPAIGREHPDYIALRLAVMALGGYFGSRLMANIREEKGLTYGINAALLGTHEGAMIEINAQCDQRYVDAVISETIKEIENLSVNPPVGDELERLRLHAWMQLASSADSTFATLEHYITRLKVGTPREYFNQQLHAVRSLTPETLARVATQWIQPANLSVVTSGA